VTLTVDVLPQINFPGEPPSVSGEPVNKDGKTKTGNDMRLKLLVQTQEFQNWPATKDRPASTSHNLICLDMSQPADSRMTESISYRLKEEEIPKYWDKAMDKTIEVVCRRIAHSKSGKASLIGEIVETPQAAK
jgi:hypothetical protein